MSYTPPAAQDGSGNQQTHEQFAATAEDNVNQVVATLDKPIVGASYAPSIYWGVNTQDHEVKTSPGNLLSCHLVNRNAAARYALFVNSASGATTPVVAGVQVPAAGTLTLGREFFSRAGIYFPAGITILFSTSQAGYAAPTPGDHDCMATFV